MTLSPATLVFLLRAEAVAPTQQPASAGPSSIKAHPPRGSPGAARLARYAEFLAICGEAPDGASASRRAWIYSVDRALRGPHTNDFRPLSPARSRSSLP
jgi:hypothetical protein